MRWKARIEITGPFDTGPVYVYWKEHEGWSSVENATVVDDARVPVLTAELNAVGVEVEWIPVDGESLPGDMT